MHSTDLVDQAQLRSDHPEFGPGDTVKVHVRVVEGNRERTQMFEGYVIARRGSGIRESFTVRKLSFGVGVERTFPLHAPTVAKKNKKKPLVMFADRSCITSVGSNW